MGQLESGRPADRQSFDPRHCHHRRRVEAGGAQAGTEGFLPTVDLVARWAVAGRRGQFLWHRLEHLPHERRDGGGGGGEPGGLLYAGLVPGFAQRDLLLAAARAKDEKRLLLDTTLDW